MSLPTTYRDDILDTTQNTQRVYDIKDATSGTVIQQNVVLEDKTVYTQQGTTFGATDINNITETINDLTVDITLIRVSQNKPAEGVEGGLYFTFS